MEPENSRKARRKKRHFSRCVLIAIACVIALLLFHWAFKGAVYEIEHHNPGSRDWENNTEYVYCSASSPIYAERADTQSVGMLIDVVNYFTDTSIAELVDNNGFPIAIPYKAYAHEENRYQIEYGGNTYWIDPQPSLLSPGDDEPLN